MFQPNIENTQEMFQLFQCRLVLVEVNRPMGLEYHINYYTAITVSHAVRLRPTSAKKRAPTFVRSLPTLPISAHATPWIRCFTDWCALARYAGSRAACMTRPASMLSQANQPILSLGRSLMRWLVAILLG